MKVYIVESTVCGTSHPIAASFDGDRASELINGLNGGESKYAVVEIEVIG